MTNHQSDRQRIAWFNRQFHNNMMKANEKEGKKKLPVEKARQIVMARQTAFI